MTIGSVSIIVPAYNCSATISKTITSILNQNCLVPFELIVVDDGSTDDTARIIKSFPKVSYQYQANAGPAAARNRGAEVANGDILFFTDSDCIPRVDWIEKMLVHFEKADIAVVAGSYGIVNPQSWLASGIHAEIIFRHHKLMPSYPKAFGSYNFSIRRDIFKEVEGFDTTYRYASGEDNDLSYKIIKSGYKIFFAREALVDHHHTESLQRYLSEQYRHGYWRAKMYKDHPEMAKGDDYTFFKDIVEMPLALFTLVGFMLFFLNMVTPAALWIWVLLFAGLEVFYGLLMNKNFLQALGFSAVMFLRSFSRLGGFLSGLVSFLPPKKS